MDPTDDIRSLVRDLSRVYDTILASRIQDQRQSILESVLTEQPPKTSPPSAQQKVNINCRSACDTLKSVGVGALTLYYGPAQPSSSINMAAARHELPAAPQKPPHGSSWSRTNYNVLGVDGDVIYTLPYSTERQVDLEAVIEESGRTNHAKDPRQPVFQQRYLADKCVFVVLAVYQLLARWDYAEAAAHMCEQELWDALVGELDDGKLRVQEGWALELLQKLAAGQTLASSAPSIDTSKLIALLQPAAVKSVSKLLRSPVTAASRLRPSESRNALASAASPSNPLMRCKQVQNHEPVLLPQPIAYVNHDCSAATAAIIHGWSSSISPRSPLGGSAGATPVVTIGRSRSTFSAAAAAYPDARKNCVADILSGQAVAASSMFVPFSTQFCKRCFTYNCMRHAVPKVANPEDLADMWLHEIAPKTLARQLNITSSASGATSHAVPAHASGANTANYCQYCGRTGPAGSGADSAAAAAPSVPSQQRLPNADTMFRAYVMYAGDICKAARLLGVSCRALNDFILETAWPAELEHLQHSASTRPPPAEGHNAMLVQRGLIKALADERKQRGLGNEPAPVSTCHHSGPCPGVSPDEMDIRVTTGDDADVHAVGACACANACQPCGKSCGCGDDCARRWRGCRCKAKPAGKGGKGYTPPCRDARSCPCLMAGRECDPDLCLGCCAAEVCEISQALGPDRGATTRPPQLPPPAELVQRLHRALQQTQQPRAVSAAAAASTSSVTEAAPMEASTDTLTNNQIDYSVVSISAGNTNTNTPDVITISDDTEPTDDDEANDADVSPFNDGSGQERGVDAQGLVTADSASPAFDASAVSHREAGAEAGGEGYYSGFDAYDNTEDDADGGGSRMISVQQAPKRRSTGKTDRGDRDGVPAALLAPGAATEDRVAWLGRQTDPRLARRARNLFLTQARYCRNVGIQAGRRKLLRVGESRLPNAGMGLFLMEPAAKDDLLTEYVGELISEAEGNARGRWNDDVFGFSYLFGLDTETQIDALRIGNKSRYANNIKVRDVTCVPRISIVGSERRIALYAQRALAPGTELLFDYGYQDNQVAWQKDPRYARALAPTTGLPKSAAAAGSRGSGSESAPSASGAARAVTFALPASGAKKAKGRGRRPAGSASGSVASGSAAMDDSDG